jgi:hypothetical protein
MYDTLSGIVAVYVLFLIELQFFVRSYTSIWLHNSQLINFQYVSCLFYECLQETVSSLTCVIRYIYY